jgi:hypothetical protein
VIKSCDRLGAQELRYFLRAAFTGAATLIALAFGAGLSCGVINPIGRLCGSGAASSWRIESINSLGLRGQGLRGQVSQLAKHRFKYL